MTHIGSVPYKVTLRWVFYRLLQDGLYHDKSEYKASFIPLQSKARKSFYDGWRPDTLADDTRQVLNEDNGWDSVQEWIEALAERRYHEIVWHSQKHYVEVWFEAEAMAAQFRHYVNGIPLLAFKGECSIAAKWAAAKRLENNAKRHNLPVVVLYFGDDDPKGREIPDNAASDIRQWCSVPFEFIRGGLNPGDGERLGIPQSIDKPGAYQWEALNDEQAGQLITGVVGRYFDREAADSLEHNCWDISHDFQTRIREFVEHYGDR